MADVVIVQPQIGDWDDFRSHPSLPLACLSACRYVAKEFSTVFIDTRIDKDWKTNLKRELENKPLCVGVTSMTGRQIGFALEISRYVKKESRVPVVWGGIHASLLPESILENDAIDAVVIGEGELSFLELVRSLADRRVLAGIKGVWYKEAGKIVRNAEREFLRLDDLPDLPLSLVGLEYFLPIFQGRRTYYIETSRGCPNHCKFCYNSIYNKSRWRGFSAERVVRELKYLYEHFNIGSFYVVDDNFFHDLKRAQAIAQGIIDEKLDIFWIAQGITVNSALKMDNEYLDLLVRSGLKKVHFGVESASERILERINKNINISDVLKINKEWRRYELIIQYNFMCGFPQETMEDIRQTIDLVFRLMKDNPRALISPLCPYTPYPGTALYQESLESGFLKKKSLEEWVKTDYGDNLWESEHRRKFISSLFFASMFLDRHRCRDMVESKALRLLMEFYRPVARLRVKHLFFKFMPEVKIKNLLRLS